MGGQRHHFVPQFYLRNFSRDDRSIELLLIPSQKVVRRASISRQCYRKNFYGASVENELARFESETAPLIRRILSAGELAFVDTTEWGRLLRFLTFQYSRTRSKVEAHAQSQEILLDYLREASWDSAGPPEVLSSKISREDVVQMSLKISERSWVGLSDLDARLLHSETRYEFLTSDAPVVMYNRWAEGVEGVGVVGLCVRGLLLTLPLSSRYCMFVFDPGVYAVDGESMGTIRLTSKDDIVQLNRLQVLGADEVLYFENVATGALAGRLVNLLRNRRAERAVRLTVADPKERETDKTATDNRHQLVHTYSPMPNIRLKLSFLKIRPKLRREKWSGVVEYRPASHAILNQLLEFDSPSRSRRGGSYEVVERRQWEGGKIFK